MEDLLIFLQAEENDLQKNDEFFETNYNERLLYFHQWVEKLHKGSFTYLEAIANFAEEHDIEVEKCAKYISADLKQKIYEESVALNLMKRKSDDTHEHIF